METICRKLYDCVCTHGSTTDYKEILAKVYPDEPDLSKIMFSMSADKLHEVLITIQLNWIKILPIMKTCRHITPFVVQARKDARSAHICEAIGSIAQALTKNTQTPEAIPEEAPSIDAPVVNSAVVPAVTITPVVATEVAPDPKVVAARELLVGSFGMHVDMYCLWRNEMASKGLVRNHNQWPSIYEYYAAHGLIDQVKACVDDRIQHDHDLAGYAAENGCLNIVSWLIEVDEPVNKAEICEIAATHGYLSILKYMDRMWELDSTINHCNGDLIKLAATHGHLPIIQWLIMRGGTISPSFIQADAKDHPHVIQWIDAMYG